MDQPNHISQRTEHLRAWFDRHRPLLNLTGIEKEYDIPSTLLIKWLNRNQHRGKPTALPEVHLANLERVLQPLGYVPLTSDHQFL